VFNARIMLHAFYAHRVRFAKQRNKTTNETRILNYVKRLLLPKSTDRRPCSHGRRHGFESGGTILWAERAKKNFWPPTFWPVGG